jgi:hypothetical protein
MKIIKIKKELYSFYGRRGFLYNYYFDFFRIYLDIVDINNKAKIFYTLYVEFTFLNIDL